MSVIDEIADERQRQVEQEGWTSAHDDDHDDGQLARAAGCYALYAGGRRDMVRSAMDCPEGGYVPRGWPWAVRWWKPKNPRRDLIRAAALIVAEIERIDRAAIARARGEER